MRSFFSLCLFVLAQTFAVCGAELVSVIPYHDDYMEFHAGEAGGIEDLKMNPSVFMGYPRQVSGGAYNGASDFSARISFGYDSRGLLFLMSVTDDVFIGPDTLSRPDEYILDYGWAGSVVHKVRWPFAGEGTVEVEGVTVTTQIVDGGSLLFIRAPWPDGRVFSGIPVKVNFTVLDRDGYNEKIIKLSEMPMSVYRSERQFTQDAAVRILKPAPYGDAARDSGIYCEVDVHSDGVYGYRILVNGRESRGEAELAAGMNAMRIRTAAHETGTDNSVTLSVGSHEDTVSYVQPAAGPVYPFDSRDVPVQASALMRDVSSSFDSLNYDEAHEIFNIREGAGGTVLMITGSYDDIYDALVSPLLADTFSVRGFVLKKESDIYAMNDLFYWMQSLGEELRAVVIFPSGQEKTADYMMKKIRYRLPPVYLPYPEIMGRMFFEPEFENLSNYNITILYDKNRSEPPVARFMKYVPLTYTDKNSVWGMIEAEKSAGARNGYLKSVNIGHNLLPGLKVYGLSDYSMNYFSVNTDMTDEAGVYTENVSCFSYDIPTRISSLNINGAEYPVFPGQRNFFIFDEESGVWNVMVAEHPFYPSLSDFFRRALSAADAASMDAFKRMTGHRLFDGDGDAVIFCGDTMPAGLARRFGVIIRDGEIRTVSGNTIAEGESFAAVFSDGESLLLWCNVDPTPFIDFPVNYVVTDREGNPERLGGVLPR